MMNFIKSNTSSIPKMEAFSDFGVADESLNITVVDTNKNFGVIEEYLKLIPLHLNETNSNIYSLNNSDGKFTYPIFNFPLSEVYTIVQENNSGSYLDPTAKIIIMLMYIILIVVGTLGNVLVALVIARRQEMRTARNLYVINLTISDVTLCLICMPFTLASLMEKNWKLGNFICKLVPVLQCTNILVSTATIVAIAADRYMTIVRIGRGPRNKHYNKISVAAIWVVSLMFPLPLFSYYYLEPVKVQHFLLYERCVEVWSSRKIKIAWTITLIIIQYIIPILVLIYVHIHIKNFLNKHKMNKITASRQVQELDRNRRTTILLTTIAGTFAVSWLPWHVVNFLADFNYFKSPKYFYAVFGVCHILAMSTACSNPVLYGWLNTTLSGELRVILDALKKKTGLKCWQKNNTDDNEDINDSVTRRYSIRKLSFLAMHDGGNKIDNSTREGRRVTLSPNSPTKVSAISDPGSMTFLDIPRSISAERAQSYLDVSVPQTVILEGAKSTCGDAVQIIISQEKTNENILQNLNTSIENCEEISNENGVVTFSSLNSREYSASQQHRNPNDKTTLPDINTAFEELILKINQD